jgi:hypothetical protein
MISAGMRPFPRVIRLSSDYTAPLPLWGEGLGNVDWRFTKFPPKLLDRLAAWQRDFDDNYHDQAGWRSAAIRDHWAHQAKDLATDVQAALGSRAELVVDLWPIDKEPGAVPRICDSSGSGSGCCQDQVRLGIARQAVPAGAGGAAGTRTQDRRIMSPDR